jgi:hypothetical protein
MCLSGAGPYRIQIKNQLLVELNLAGFAGGHFH